MTEATWGGAGSSEIDPRTSAALENTRRRDGYGAEVRSLEEAVAAWLTLDSAHGKDATLTIEHPVIIDGSSMTAFAAEGIVALAERLPGETPARSNTDTVDDVG